MPTIRGITQRGRTARGDACTIRARRWYWIFTHSEHCCAGGVDRGTVLPHHHMSGPCSFPHGCELGDGSVRQSSLIGHVWPRLSHSSQQSKSRGWRPSISFAPDLRTFLLRRQDNPHRSTTKNRTYGTSPKNGHPADRTHDDPSHRHREGRHVVDGAHDVLQKSSTRVRMQGYFSPITWPGLRNGGGRAV